MQIIQNANSFILKIREDLAGPFQVQVGSRPKGFTVGARSAHMGILPWVCLVEVPGHWKAK